jgi:hypothetical protein
LSAVRHNVVAFGDWLKQWSNLGELQVEQAHRAAVRDLVGRTEHSFQKY